MKKFLASAMGRVYVSTPKTEGLSVYQWSVPEKNKHGG